MVKIETYGSDDYTGFTFGKYTFYFGYEQTQCPICRKRFSYDECEKHSDADAIWCFVVTHGKTEIFSKAIKDFDGVRDGFYKGMAYYLQTILPK